VYQVYDKRIFFSKHQWNAVVMGGTSLLCVFELQRFGRKRMQRSTCGLKSCDSGRFLLIEAP
jgi:hypothetical protein